jgi:iron complex transport system ATP-binding protein
MIKVENLIFSYNGTQVLKNLNLEIKPGKISAILGPNGAGKSTFLKCLNAILKPKGGCIYIDGVDINRFDLKDIAKKIGYVPQKSNPVLTTVFDYVLLGRKPYISFGIKKEDLRIVENALETLGIEEIAMKKLNQLSGGELQKVVIARAFAQQAKIFLLDEPVNNLDLKSQYELMKLLKRLTFEKEITVVIVLHDINIALRFADEFVFMKEGKIIAKGGKEIVTPELIEEVYGIKVQIEEISGVPVLVYS